MCPVHSTTFFRALIADITHEMKCAISGSVVATRGSCALLLSAHNVASPSTVHVQSLACLIFKLQTLAWAAREVTRTNKRIAFAARFAKSCKQVAIKYRVTFIASRFIFKSLQGIFFLLLPLLLLQQTERLLSRDRSAVPMSDLHQMLCRVGKWQHIHSHTHKTNVH